MDNSDSLVAREWGDDLPDLIAASSGLATTVYPLHDRRYGLLGEFLDVGVSRRLS